MSFTNVFIGDDKNLKLYKGDDINGFIFTVTNKSDDSAYDFTGAQDQNILIYSDVDRITIAATVLAADLTIANNEVIWSSDYATALNLDIGQYYYSLTYVDANGKTITISKGKMLVS